jgi:hypothetical protein
MQEEQSSRVKNIIPISQQAEQSASKRLVCRMKGNATMPEAYPPQRTEEAENQQDQSGDRTDQVLFLPSKWSPQSNETMVLGHGSVIIIKE